MLCVGAVTFIMGMTVMFFFCYLMFFLFVAFGGMLYEVFQ